MVDFDSFAKVSARWHRTWHIWRAEREEGSAEQEPRLCTGLENGGQWFYLQLEEGKPRINIWLVMVCNFLHFFCGLWFVDSQRSWFPHEIRHIFWISRRISSFLDNYSQRGEQREGEREEERYESAKELQKLDSAQPAGRRWTIDPSEE